MAGLQPRSELETDYRQKLAQPARLFVDRLKRRTLRTFDGKFKKRTGFGPHPRRIKPGPSIIFQGPCQEL